MLEAVYTDFKIGKSISIAIENQLFAQEYDSLQQIWFQPRRNLKRPFCKGTQSAPGHRSQVLKGFNILKKELIRLSSWFKA